MSFTRREFLAASGGALAAAAAAGCAGPRSTSTSTASAEEGAAGPLRILILGGTSFLGPELVEAARARGHALTLFNRGRTRPGLFPDVEQLRGDRDGKLEALRGRSWDVAIDTSGYVPRIVKASAELLSPQVGRYQFVSSISVYADSRQPVDEGSPLAKAADERSEDVRADYGALKALCEQAAERALPGRTLAVRPGLIVGPGDPTDRFTYWPVRLDRGGEVLAPGTGKDPVQVIDVRDLAAWMIRAAEGRLAGTFNAVGPATPMADLVAACTPPGATARLTWVDEAFLEREKVEPWSDLPVWIPASSAEAGLSSARIDRALARGLAFRPLGATAADTLAWWKAQPAERRAKLRAGLSAEREAAVLVAWRARAPAPSPAR